MSDPLYDALDRMQVNSGYDSDEPAITDFVEDTPISDWEMDMINASDEVEQSGRHGQSSNASEPRRLEDLAPHLMEAMLQIASDKVDTDHDTIWLPLYEMGLVSYDESADDSADWFDTLTDKGNRWVADYQQRKARTPADVAAYDAMQAESVEDKPRKPSPSDPYYKQEGSWDDYEADMDIYHQMKEAWQEQHTETLEAELATVRAELQAAREREAALWKFYDFMFSVDATGDVMEMLKDDMVKGAAHELLTGDSQMNHDAVKVWADYDALLTELKALKASSK